MLIKALTYEQGSRSRVQQSVLKVFVDLQFTGLISGLSTAAKYVRSFTVQGDHLPEVERILQRRHIPYKKETAS